MLYQYQDICGHMIYTVFIDKNKPLTKRLKLMIIWCKCYEIRFFISTTLDFYIPNLDSGKYHLKLLFRHNK